MGVGRVMWGEGESGGERMDGGGKGWRNVSTGQKKGHGVEERGMRVGGGGRIPLAIFRDWRPRRGVEPPPPAMPTNARGASFSGKLSIELSHPMDAFTIGVVC